MNEPATHEDKFIAMVTAKAEVNLRLSEFQPRSMLVTPVHDLKRAKFPAIDYHNHLDAQDPAAVLKVMDECGIERIVNITMQVGNEALAVIKRFHSSAPGRFATYAWMDWTDLNSGRFLQPLRRSAREDGGARRLRSENLEGSGHESAGFDGRFAAGR